MLYTVARAAADAAGGVKAPSEATETAITTALPPPNDILDMRPQMTQIVPPAPALPEAPPSLPDGADALLSLISAVIAARPPKTDGESNAAASTVDIDPSAYLAINALAFTAKGAKDEERNIR